MVKRVCLLILLFTAFIGYAGAEESVESQLKLLEAEQLELTKEQIQTYKSELENKVSALDNRVSLKLGLWGLLGLGLSAMGGFIAGMIWKSRDIPEIVAKEIAKSDAKFQAAMDQKLSESRSAMSTYIDNKLNDQSIAFKEGLERSVRESISSLESERNSKILIVIGESDCGLHRLLPQLGFDQKNFSVMTLNSVFDYHSGDITPNDQEFNLVILDSLKQEDAYHFVKAGQHQSYLLYKEGTQYKFGKDENKQPYPHQFDRNRTIIANSKPTVYGHIMTLLSFNKKLLVQD